MKSFKQSFLVRRNKTEANNSAIVYARIVVDGMRTEFSLQREVNINLWCAEKSMALGNSRECKELNRYIDTVRLKVFQIYRELVANDKPVSCQILKEKVLGIDSKEIAMFLDIFKKHNEKFEALIGIDYSRSTLIKYKTCYSTLQEFIRLKYKSDDLEVTRLNYEFLVDFEFFLKTQKRCAHNTVMGYIKKVKKIVRQCVAMDLLDKDPFMAFKITIRDVQRNLLTQDELDLLRLKSLSIVRIGIVRDIFLFCCYTGLDMTRVCSITVLTIHFYYYCHDGFSRAGYTLNFIDTIIVNIAGTGIFRTVWVSKGIILSLLGVSLLGVSARKVENVRVLYFGGCVLLGSLIFLGGHVVWQLPLTAGWKTIVYIFVTLVGYISILTGGVWLSRYVKIALRNDIFNTANQSFPQEERLLENEYSVNLPAQYTINGNKRRSWVNFINPFRALLVIGTPGAGKSYFVIRHIITQHIRKGFSMFIYDFKYDDLSIIAYNALLKYSRHYTVPPRFYVIEFDKIVHRCNPLDPVTMEDITDASESSRTIMLGLNRDWIKKQGDFFVESPINFVTAIIWFLRKYEGGIYCTLPHVIELMQLDYKVMFPLLRTEPEIDVLINPFESAYRHEAWEQLEGQIASAKIGMARLSSPQLYYVLSGNDFTLDINNPAAPKVVCMGNNPQKQQIFGAVLSLYIARVIKLVNKKGKLKSSLIFDEFPTVYFNNIDSLIATARSNKVATTVAVQDYSQLKKDYGRDQAEVIMNIVGNVISGQVVGETSKLLSERFGRIVQERTSISINRSDTSVSRSTQLEPAIPPSRIASLSSGEFVGMVADDPLQKIELKLFHAEILNDHAALQKEEEAFKPIPTVRQVSADEIRDNYLAIKEDIKIIIASRLPDAA